MRQRAPRLRYEVTYMTGSYRQDDLPVRKRLRDEDVEEFIRDWLRGLAPAFIGGKYRSPGYWTRPGEVRGRLTYVEEGAPLHYKMVYRHVQRLADGGHIEQRFARAQPDWRALAAEAAGQPLTVTSGKPTGAGGYDALPVGLRTAARRGRPKRRLKPGKDYQSPIDMLRGRPRSPADEPLIMHVYEPDAVPPGAAGGVLDPAAFERERQAIEQAEALARAELDRMRQRAAAEIETAGFATEFPDTPDSEETSDHATGEPGRIQEQGEERREEEPQTGAAEPDGEGRDTGRAAPRARQRRRKGPASAGTEEAQPQGTPRGTGSRSRRRHGGKPGNQ